MYPKLERDIIVLDIEEELVLLDYIFMMYGILPNELNPNASNDDGKPKPKLFFVKGIRYPLMGEQKRKYLGNNTESTAICTPIHPFLSVNCVVDLIKFRLHTLSNFPLLFSRSDLIPDGCDLIENMGTANSPREIIFGYIPNISKNDLVAFTNIMESIFSALDRYLNVLVDRVIDFDVETSRFIILPGKNIKEFRYDEAVGRTMDAARIEKAIRDECNEELDIYDKNSTTYQSAIRDYYERKVIGKNGYLTANKTAINSNPNGVVSLGYAKLWGKNRNKFLNEFGTNIKKYTLLWGKEECSEEDVERTREEQAKLDLNYRDEALRSGSTKRAVMRVLQEMRD